jgi:ABC-type multidrug transport system fused ATPase/permease subunit
MNTGDFEYNSNIEVITLFFPIVMILFVYSGSRLVSNIVRERHEHKIDQILDLQGRNSGVDFLLNLIIFGTISLPATILVAIFCNLICFVNVGVLVTVFIVIMFAIQMTLIELIFSYGLSYWPGLIARVLW